MPDEINNKKKKKMIDTYADNVHLLHVLTIITRYICDDTHLHILTTE